MTQSTYETPNVVTATLCPGIAQSTYETPNVVSPGIAQSTYETPNVVSPGIAQSTYDNITDKNLAYTIIGNYFEKEQTAFTLIIILVILINALQTNVITSITSSLIDAVEHNQYTQALTQYKYFIAGSIVYLVIYSLNELLQVRVLTQLTPWMRIEFFKYILRMNNENLSQQNVNRYNSPINRVSYSATSMLSTIITIVLSNGAFIAIITGFFLYKNTLLGITFLLLNTILMFYAYVTWDSSMKYKEIYESHLNQNEQTVIDLFNNFDKIIYRGKVESEIAEYENRVETCVKTSMDFYNTNTQHHIVMLSLIYIIIFLTVGYLIYSKINKTIDTKTFITFLTILLLYRDKLSSLLQIIPQFMEFKGRINYALTHLKDISVEKTPNPSSVITYTDMNLRFDSIRFESVSYKYDASEKYLFQNLNVNIDTTQQIIGITGNSGKGKSTIMKLLLKLYKNYEGNIYIDETNIREIDPLYIRKNITYVNQSSKLFDKPVIDNMLYGCSNQSDCSKYLEIIMKYPLVRELFKNVDVDNTTAGSLGENLSGGQRQVVNILSGLINPSPILILDEPTNALDLSLKQELLGIIETFKQYKKCIIIITHDRDAYPLFDTRLRI
jgi:ABC-type bacteriocin/lantibiotic exporter with double-glycine peptidase domain